MNRAEVVSIIRRFAASVDLPDWIPLSIAQVESGLDPAANAIDTNGVYSTGLFQLNQLGQGYGHTIASLIDPEINCEIGIPPMVAPYHVALEMGLDGFDLLAYVASHSGHPDEIGFMPDSYRAALAQAYTIWGGPTMGKLICIAPGHGGFDAGICANGVQEKNITLALGLALQQALQEAKVSVVMTRTTDVAAGDATNLLRELQNEVATANNSAADLFIGLDCAGGEGRGASAYVYRTGPESTLASQLVESLAELVGTTTPSVIVDPSLYVLKETNMPAIVVNLGVITDPVDAQLLATQAKEIADTIAKPLIAWAGGSVPQPLVDVAHLPAEVETAIAEMEKLGVMTADAAGNFDPDATVSRWELAVALNRFHTSLKG